MFGGHTENLALLNGLWSERGGAHVTCPGRRRIGKSTLIEEFASRFVERPTKASSGVQIDLLVQAQRSVLVVV